MPVILNEIQYTDAWGDVLNFYRANAGDVQTARLKCTSNIQVTSVEAPITIDPINEAFISSSSSFEDEGFRVGQTVSIRVLESNGTPTLSVGTSTITYVNGNEIRILNDTGFYVYSSGQILEITVTDANRESINGNFNMVLNSTNGNDLSLIDSESTRFYFSGIDALTLDVVTDGVFVGNQSGAIVKDVKITRKTTTVGYAQAFWIDITFVNTGFYDSTWFDSSDCLKPYYKLLWSTVEGEPFAQTSLIVSDNANSGYFNQAHNTSVTNSNLVLDVNELDYSIPSTFDIVVNGVITDLGIGACYVPIDDTYFKNKIGSQSEFTMIVETSDLLVSTYTSVTNPNGAGYTLEVNSIVTLGLQTTINVTFTPNALFTTFIDSNDSTDRTFYLWIKCGNLNLTAFGGELTKAVPVGGALTLNSSKAFYDHSQNINTTSVETVDTVFDTEDDLAFWCDFKLEKNQTYSNVKCRIIAEDTVTNDNFTLQETIFDLSNAPVSAGIYFTNQTLTINPNLPTTSIKRQAFLKNKASLNDMSNFGMELYYPFILRYEYWINQINADPYFYPNQNKNWVNYSDVGNWILKFEIELVKNDLAYIYTQEITDKDYDSEAVVTSALELIREIDSSVVTSVISGEIHRIKSTHTLTVGAWNPLTTWGQITIKQKETSNRFISSTVIDYDGNVNNPLYPISGTKCSITFTSPETVVLECFFDANKFDVSDYEITPKIKDNSFTLMEVKTTSPDDVNKTTSPDDIVKSLA